MFVGVAAGCCVAIATLFIAIAPREEPLVTVYMQPDCSSCRRWMEYLNARGFRTEIGKKSDWAAVRARFRLAPGFRGAHTAVVDGLFVEGQVPAGDIHSVLQLRGHVHIRGLVVPGLPRGSPGVDSVFPEPYTVFAVQSSGLMRPFAVHNHD